jgi:AraC-like DNA-binding protein
MGLMAARRWRERMLHERIGLALGSGGSNELAAEDGNDPSTGAEGPGLLRMPGTHHMHFRRPLPEVLPGLLSGDYEGTHIPLHTHEALLVVLPITRFVVLGGGAAVPTGPGGRMHCQARLLLVSTDLLHEVARTASNQGSMMPRFRNVPLSDPALAQAFSALWEELERPVKSSQVAGQCRTLLRELVQRHGEAEEPAVVGQRTHVAIRQVLEQLQRHVTEPQALQELAALARVSKSYLVREFHRVVGLPPHAYHVQLRIARAAQLLAMGLSLSRAAFEAGFADQSHLSRRFKAAYGITPLRFARAVRPATGPAPHLARPSQWLGATSFNNVGQDAARRVG